MKKINHKKDYLIEAMCIDKEKGNEIIKTLLICKNTESVSKEVEYIEKLTMKDPEYLRLLIMLFVMFRTSIEVNYINKK